MHGLRALPSLPPVGQWANFVRNHDEWTLDKLTEAERAGGVRRLRARRRRCSSSGGASGGGCPPCWTATRPGSAWSTAWLFSLPGAPVLFYGEEIGMGENLAIPGRMSVRSPMQWSRGPNGGFSTAPTERCAARWSPPALEPGRR